MKCNLDFKSTLKSTLISKRQFLPWNQGWFQGNLNLSQVHNVHNVSVVSSEEGVHIIISNDSLEQFSWMILLNNSFKRLSCCAIGVLQVPVFYEKLLWYLFSYLRFILLVIRIWTRYVLKEVNWPMKFFSCNIDQSRGVKKDLFQV